MNAERRKRIEAAKEKLKELKDEIASIAEEEREYYDGMPDAFREGDMGDAADEAASALESAAEALEGAYDNLDEAVA